VATLQETLVRQIAEAARAAASEVGLDPADVPEPGLERPRQKEHGDWATNLALVLAPKAGRKPREVAEAIAAHLDDGGVVDRVEVAGPGFINVFLRTSWLADALRHVLVEGDRYGRSNAGEGRRVQVEFVSANPTGPLHIGHARNAVLGDAIASLLAATGHRVEREYYYNDAGRQMELFGRSVDARWQRLHGRDVPVPEEGYAGDYVKDVAAQVDPLLDPPILDLPEDERWPKVLAAAVPIMLAEIEATLSRFGVVFDSYGLEHQLRQSGAIDRAIERLREAEYVEDRDGAVWFRSTAFGDDKDRVLVRSNGEPTYFAADAAYVIDKFSRGFDHLVYVWGADHHGDVVRVKGAATALGFDPEAVEIVLYQFVSFLREGKPVPLSKRSGAILTLDELLDEVGPDAARYTLLARSPDSAMEFDIAEVKRQTMENPVYYVQYAHARIASILRVAAEQGVSVRPLPDVDLGLLRAEAEADLIAKLAEFPEVVDDAARARAPHRLTHFAEGLAAAFHRFYRDCRVVSDEADLTQARLWLVTGTKQVLAASLRLLGVGAPEAMERIGEEPEGT
jgi:arginyl-tRNA synthetase